MFAVFKCSPRKSVRSQWKGTLFQLLHYTIIVNVYSSGLNRDVLYPGAVGFVSKSCQQAGLATFHTRIFMLLNYNFSTVNSKISHRQLFLSFTAALLFSDSGIVSWYVNV